MKNDILTAARQTEQVRGAAIGNDDRPAFHLSPYCGWMNDPNGFSYYKGEYHLYNVHYLQMPVIHCCITSF